MSHEILSDASFFFFLLLIDRDIATRAHGQRCPFCGGRLDIGNYRRKPRGCLCVAPAGFDVRYSLCCRKDGCRRRAPPASIRFLDRRVYLGIVTIVVCAMRSGISNSRFKSIQAELNVDFNTIKSWKKYWTESFPTSARGKTIHARLPPGGSADDLLVTVCQSVTDSINDIVKTATSRALVLGMLMTDDPVYVGKIASNLAVTAFPQRTPTDT